MKKPIILAIAIVFGAFNANAQFGGVLKEVAMENILN